MECMVQSSQTQYALANKMITNTNKKGLNEEQETLFCFLAIKETKITAHWRTKAGPRTQYQPVDWSILGSIPFKGTYLGCVFNPQ